MSLDDICREAASQTTLALGKSLREGVDDGARVFVLVANFDRRRLYTSAFELWDDETIRASGGDHREPESGGHERRVYVDGREVALRGQAVVTDHHRPDRDHWPTDRRSHCAGESVGEGETT